MYTDPFLARELAIAMIQERLREAQQARLRASLPRRQGNVMWSARRHLGRLLVTLGSWLERITLHGEQARVNDVTTVRPAVR